MEGGLSPIYTLFRNQGTLQNADSMNQTRNWATELEANYPDLYYTSELLI